MDNSVINELLNKANMDSKKNLTKEEQKKYRDALVACFKESGINDDTVFYYVSGIKYGSTISFMIWNRQFDEKEQAQNFDMLIKSEKLKNQDNVAKLRIVLSLLVEQLCEDVQNDMIVGGLFHLLVELSYKKDGTRLSNIGMIFRTCFLNNIRYGLRLPDLNRFGFTKEYLFELITFLEEAVREVSPKGDKEIINKNIVRDWVAIEKEKTGMFNESAEGSKVCDNIQKSQEIDTTYKNTCLQQSKLLGVKSGLAKKILGILEEVETVDTKFHAAQDELKKNEKDISRLKIQLNKIEDLYKASTDENNKLRSELVETKNKCEELEIKNTELVNRVNRQVSVMDIYDQDKANTKDEIQNQIATGLKKIYEDYKTAIDMEMTIDLGENMRDSLDDIFRKLRKMGIDIEGR